MATNTDAMATDTDTMATDTDTMATDTDTMATGTDTMATDTMATDTMVAAPEIIYVSYAKPTDKIHALALQGLRLKGQKVSSNAILFFLLFLSFSTFVIFKQFITVNVY